MLVVPDACRALGREVRRPIGRDGRDETERLLFDDPLHADCEPNISSPPGLVDPSRQTASAPGYAGQLPPYAGGSARDPQHDLAGHTASTLGLEGLLAALQGEHFADDGPHSTGVNPPGKLRKRRSVGLTGFAGMTSEDPVFAPSLVSEDPR